MVLFEVPGWTVPSTAPSQSSQKRKRPGGNDARDKIQSAEMNLDKLMNKLRGDKPEDDSPRAPKKLKRTESDSGVAPDTSSSSGKGKGVSDWGLRKKGKKTSTSMISGPKRMRPKKELSNSTDASSSMQTLTRVKSPATSIDIGSTASKSPSPKKAVGVGLTSMQKDMKQSLDGARFRWINEALYKADSSTSHELMREDPKVYEEYHTGFRHQVHSWPTNPVSHYISALSTYPKGTVIADLGCGDAALARELVPKELTVLSFDLVSDGAFVVEADICAKIPLPGSEGAEGQKSEGEGHIVDVVVCALSLMGTNWPSCIREAWRILKPGGELKIAEVTSRFTDLEEFTYLVNSIGFKLKSKDESNTHFTLIDFKKVARKGKNDKEWAKILSNGSLLKPCEYKRR